jgi:6-phosphogluconolactonase
VLFGDERCVPPEHDDSNFRLARETLLDQLPIPPAQVLRMEGELPPVHAAERYEVRLRQLFPSAAAPAFDLVLMGLGADGHTLSLFPGTSALDESRRWVVAQEVPSRGWRLTLTPAALPAARVALWLVVGSDKRGALHELAGGACPGRTAPSPARRVLGLLGEAEILADGAAMGSF